MAIYPSYGGATYKTPTKFVIRLILMGCSNRPFFHIAVQEKFRKDNFPVIEQIGNYDALPNKYNEKLVAINFERLEYWLRLGAEPSSQVKMLLGLSGYFPVHPFSFKEAFLKRKFVSQELEKLKIEAAKITEKNIEENAKSTEESSHSISTQKPQPDVESDNKEN